MEKTSTVEKGDTRGKLVPHFPLVSSSTKAFLFYVKPFIVSNELTSSTTPQLKPRSV